MKIGILTQYFKPEMGAPPTRLYELAKGLQSLGNDVFIITGMPNYPTGKIFKQYKRKFNVSENIEGLHISRVWLYASNSKKAIPRIFNMLSFSLTSLFSLPNLIKNRLDFLIVESPPLTLGLSGVILSKLSKTKLITNISDIWPLSAKELGAISDGMVYKLLEKVEKFIYKNSFATMGQSEEIVKHISSKTNKKAFLFRNGVDPSRFQSLLSSKNTTNTEKKPLIITYAGLLGYAQGIADICKNVDFKNLGVEFHIYGDGGEKKEIEDYIKENPDKGIIYYGVISREELPEVLINSDYSLIPLIKNIYGAVPSKIYESMAAGLPIIFMGEGEGARIISKYDLGVVIAPKDYQALKDVILTIKTNHITQERMSLNCIRAAEENFNRQIQIKKLNDFLIQNLK